MFSDHCRTLGSHLEIRRGHLVAGSPKIHIVHWNTCSLKKSAFYLAPPLFNFSWYILWYSMQNEKLVKIVVYFVIYHAKCKTCQSAWYILWYTMGDEKLVKMRGIFCDIPRKMQNLLKCVVYFVIYHAKCKTCQSAWYILWYTMGDEIMP